MSFQEHFRKTKARFAPRVYWLFILFKKIFAAGLPIFVYELKTPFLLAGVKSPWNISTWYNDNYKTNNNIQVWKIANQNIQSGRTSKS